MALSFDEITATTYKKYRRTLAEQVMEKVALYAMLKKKGGVERKRGGNKIVEPLMYGLNSTFSSYNGYDTLDVTPQTGISAAEYDWKNLAVSVTISDEEEDQNSGEERIINLLKAKIDQAEKTYTLRFNEMLFGDGTGNSSKDVTGIKKYVDPTPATGTVGGINAANYSWWRNQQNTTANFSTTGLADMRTMFNDCIHEAEGTDFLMCDQTTFENYESFLVSIERINFSKGSQLMGDLGFESQMFKGKPMVWDNYCTAESGNAGVIYFLNLRYLKLIIDKTKDFRMTKWRTPYNQMARSAFIVWRGQLVCSNRRNQGRLDITAMS